MGWTGTYMERCPQGADRIAAAIHQEGLNWSDDTRRVKVIDTALRGSVIYCAVRYTGPNATETFGLVILTAYNQFRREFLTKTVTESMGPCEAECPKRILNKLSPTANETANDWRRRCYAIVSKRTAGKHDPLVRMTPGDKLRLNSQEKQILQAYIYHGRKVFVNWFTNRYYTPSQVRKIGYEII